MQSSHSLVVRSPSAAARILLARCCASALIVGAVTACANVAPVQEPIPVPDLVPVSFQLADAHALAGEWRGQYRSDETGRSGTITFSLQASRDTAFGDAVMTPLGFNAPVSPAEPQNSMTRRLPHLLAIAFVGVNSAEVQGPLELYVDPDCGCPMRTIFRGRLVNNSTLEGTYESVTTSSRYPVMGRWSAHRLTVLEK